MNKRFYQAFTILLWLLLLARPLWAHGGGLLQIATEPAGPFLISVWTSPSRLEAENVAHVTVGVAGEDEAPVLDAAVFVELASVATGEVWTAVATTAQATNKLFYEADMRLPEDGRYTMTIQVENAQGSGAVSFAIEILPEGQTNWYLFAFIGLGLLLSMGMFRLWEKQTAVPPSRKR